MSIDFRPDFFIFCGCFQLIFKTIFFKNGLIYYVSK